MAVYNLALSGQGSDSSPILTHIVTDAVTGTVYAMDRNTASRVIRGLYLSSSMDSLDMTQRYVTEPCFMFIPQEVGSYCTGDIIHNDTFKKLSLNKDLKLSADIQKMVSNIGTGPHKVAVPKTWHLDLADGSTLDLVSDSSNLAGPCGNAYSTHPHEEQVVSLLSRRRSQFHTFNQGHRARGCRVRSKGRAHPDRHGRRPRPCRHRLRRARRSRTSAGPMQSSSTSTARRHHSYRLQRWRVRSPWLPKTTM